MQIIFSRRIKLGSTSAISKLYLLFFVTFKPSSWEQLFLDGGGVLCALTRPSSDDLKLRARPKGTEVSLRELNIQDALSGSF